MVSVAHFFKLNFISLLMQVSAIAIDAGRSRSLRQPSRRQHSIAWIVVCITKPFRTLSSVQTSSSCTW